MTQKIYFLLLVFLSFSYNSYCQENHSKRSFTNNTIKTSDGVSLFAKISGKGDVCIFVHGGPGAWSESFEKLGGNILEDKLTMCYYDQRGCGKSTSPTDNNYSLDRMVDDIEDIRKNLNTSKVFIMGHSFGGILATEYARKYPQHIQGLILLNATLDINYSLRNQISFIGTIIGEYITVQNDSVLNSFFDAKKRLSKTDLNYKILSDDKASVEKVDSIDNGFKRNTSFAQHALKDPVYFKDFTKETSTIKVPTLIISGAKDNNIGPDHYLSFKFPNQDVKIIDGGHLLYYEKNQDFKNSVEQFVLKIRAK
ncbi:Proline iminopeptidase [Flavobacterium sp. ACN2]|uniref:alpha/beta fold hydrolase n=1 Tax=Flavobacterium sp. ACN2 TaxID=1975676 RepID=UPI000BB38BC2|nr:alpha/beta fold hydrolase [Flavobacterium sp. ACN2]PBI90885.1 Proline iminopeptidase [Flavobacterium sp. ACN2]